MDLSEPENLPIGGPPRVAYLDTAHADGLIHRPGRAPLDTGWRRGIDSAIRVRGGYEVTVLDKWVRFIGDDGRRRNLAVYRLPTYVRAVVASGDGRFVAITVGNANDPSVRVVVIRISDDKVVARHRFAYRVVVASFTGTRALLSTIGRTLAGYRPNVLARWWDLRTGRLRVIDNAGPADRSVDYLRWPADLTAGQVALLRGDHDLVAPLDHHSIPTWRTPADQWVVSWSPADRFVLTATVSRDPSHPGVDALTIRRASNGAPVTLFQGQSLDGWPVWEDRSTLVFHAAYGCSYTPGEGYSCTGSRLLRCTVGGTCRKVAEPAGGDAEELQRRPS